MKTITPTVFANSMNLKNAKEQEPIVPNIFSAPPETHSPKQKSEERVGKKNSSTQVKEEEIQVGLRAKSSPKNLLTYFRPDLLFRFYPMLRR
jgi:hypothetical protein